MGRNARRQYYLGGAGRWHEISAAIAAIGPFQPHSATNLHAARGALNDNVTAAVNGAVDIRLRVCAGSRRQKQQTAKRRQPRHARLRRRMREPIREVNAGISKTIPQFLAKTQGPSPAPIDHSANARTRGRPRTALLFHAAIVARSWSDSTFVPTNNNCCNNATVRPAKALSLRRFRTNRRAPPEPRQGRLQRRCRRRRDCVRSRLTQSQWPAEWRESAGARRGRIRPRARSAPP